MKERLSKEIAVISSAVALALGVTACGNETELASLRPTECSKSFGLPAVTKLPGTRQDNWFAFPGKHTSIPCALETYDHQGPLGRNAPVPGYLYSDEAFQILCTYYDKPEAVLVRGHNPRFEGTINVSDAAGEELAHNPFLREAAQPCDSSY